MDFFTRMFTSMFRSSTNRYKTRVTAQVRRATVGKVQAKSMTALENLDQKAYKSTDKLTGLNKQDKGPPSKTSAPGAAAKGGGGGAARGSGAARGGAGGGRMGSGPVSEKQQESAKMGKGKRNRRQQALSVTCMNCSSSLEVDWDMCPYCGTPVGQVSSGPQIVVGMPMAQDGGEKTVALNLDELNRKDVRSVVGWIVAQNGNHRGEDFRVYDGKNILGTAADCDIVITDPYLSAKHCTIRHENGNFQVTDLDSMNGTFVNQKRCTKSDLIDNDTIRLGRTEFKFKSLF